MARIRLVALDLDGTLVRGDTVCEVIARRLGHLDRMRALEREATDTPGLIRLREELAGYYRGRSDAEHNVRTAIVTITWTFAARWLARRFGADDVLGCDPDAVAAVGDSWRDADMFAVAGHRFFVGPALLPGLDAHHAPDGDLAAIARRIARLSA